MAKIHRLLKNTLSQTLIRKVVGEKTYNKAHFLGHGLETAAEVPELPTPIVMPEPDDEATKLARRRSLATQRLRGRSSTILSDSSDDPLG